MSIKEKFRHVLLYMKKDVTHVVCASTLNKVISLLLNILIVRIITKEEYGIYSYAFNVYSIFMVLSGAGFAAGVLQFCSEKRSEQEKKYYYKRGLQIGFSFNILMSIAIFIYGMIAEMPVEGASGYVVAFAFLPIWNFMIEYGCVFLRTQNKMVQYANISNFQTVIYAVVSILLSMIWGLKGYIAGWYISTLVTFGVTIIVTKNNNPYSNWREKITTVPLKPLLSFSIVCALTNSLSALLNYVDLEMVGRLIKDAETVAIFKTGMGLPNNAKFVTVAIMTALYPNFACNQTNYEWLKNSIRKLIFLLVIMSSCIALVFILGGEWIIILLYDKEYLDAVPILRISAISYFLASILRIPFGNILLTMRKVKFNLIISIICAIITIISDLILISNFGALGAAYTSLIVVLVSGLASFVYFMIYLNGLKKGKV